VIRRLVLSALASTALEAQTHPQPELRLDIIGPPPYTVQPGAGATLAFGYYARVTAAAGYAMQRDTTAIADRWRADVLGRFVLDPFRQHRWGVSVGGGVSVRRRAHIAALLELESPEIGGWMTALQMGASRGLRAGIVLRRAVPGRR
jgi:hypothetical protein